MFKKIVSNLPFSPALIGQLGFYAKRLRKEEVTRRLAFVFIALTLIVQSLAVFQPTESANASNANDMVTGGVSSLNEFLKKYDSNEKDIRTVINYAGITRQEIASSKYGSWKIGETLSWGFVSRFSYDQGERQHNIIDTSGKTVTVYSRPQKLWSGSTRTVYGWIGNSKKMGWFSILETCGNLVTTKIPTPVIEPKEPAPTPEPVQEPTPTPEPKCIFNNNLLANDPSCKSCPGNESIWINDSLCKPDISKSKIAINLSQGNIDASTAIAKSGDRINFTISVDNNGLNSDSIKLEDNISDVLEYSNLIDTGGGVLDASTMTLSWPKINLDYGDTQTRTFSVKILDNIPDTAQGRSDGTSYDCRILNTFGNSVSIDIDCPSVKIVEQVAAELPKTGPTENVIFICIILAAAAYFFARTRQLEKEIKIIRNNNNTGMLLLS
jgi:hypothetical protein